MSPPASRLEVHKELGGGTARAADQMDVPHHTASCSATQTGGEVCQAATAQGLARHRSAGGEKSGLFSFEIFNY